MTLSQLRAAIARLQRRVAALQRKFHRELAITKLRRTVEPIAQQWDPKDPPEPNHVIRRIADAGFPLDTYTNLHEYLFATIRKGEQPNSITMVRKLLPWAWDHRYDNLFAFDLPPLPERPARVQLPAWMLCLPQPVLR